MFANLLEFIGFFSVLGKCNKFGVKVSESAGYLKMCANLSYLTE